MISLQIFLAIYAIYAVFIIRWLNRTIKYAQKVTSYPDLAEKYEPFYRKDVQKWNYFEMCFCALTIFPIRFVTALVTIIFTAIIFPILMIGANHEKPFSTLRRFLICVTLQFVCKVSLFCAGFFFISTKKLSLADFDPEYAAKNKNRASEDTRAPLIISNHICTYDIFLHITTPPVMEVPSFLSKRAVANYPGFGAGAKAIQSVFLDRANAEDRNSIQGTIKSRLDQILAGINLPSLVIFPEGTTSAGEYLLSFKKGAFAPLVPMKIKCIQYTRSAFNPTTDVVGDANVYILAMFKFYNSATICEFDTFYPDYLELKSEDEWKVLAEKIKAIMAKALKCKVSEQGYQDQSAYEKEAIRRTKNLQEKVETPKCKDFNSPDYVQGGSTADQDK